MARQPLFEVKALSDFSGGLNDTLAPTLIKDNELQTATNVFVNLRGGIEKRYGYAKYTNPLTAFSLGQTARLMNFATQQVIGGNVSDTIILAAGSALQYVTAGSTAASWTYVYYTNGTATFTNGSTAVVRATGTAEWVAQIAVGDLISADNGTNWYTVNSITDDSNIVLSANFTQATTTTSYRVRQRVSVSYPCKGVMYNGNLYWGPSNKATANTWTIGFSADGSTSKRIVTPPATNIAPGLFSNFKNYLFTVGVAASTSRIYWSASLDATTWTSTNFVDVSPNDGTAIRGLLVHNDILYIFKDSSIWYLVGNVFDPANPTYALRKVINPQNIGTVHGDSIQVFQDRIVFLGPDGIYSLVGVNSIQNISEGKIRTTIRSILNAAAVPSTGNPPESTAIVYDNRYWLNSFITGTSNSLVIMIEPNGSFTRHALSLNNFVHSQVQTSSGGSNGAVRAMSAVDSANWNVYYFDGTATNDGSTAITATVSTKVMGFGDFSRTTHVSNVYVAYENDSGSLPAGASNAASLKVYDDAGQVGSTAAHTFPGGANQFITVQQFAVDRDTNSIYVTVTDATSNGFFRVLGIMVTTEKEAMGSGKVITS